MEKQISTLDKIKKVLGIELSEVKLAEMKLDDGVTTIEAEAFEAGQSVAVKTEDGQSIPLVEGEYKLEDGNILVVQEEGVIAEIKEEMQEEEAPEVEEEVAATEAPAAEPVAKKVVESVSKETYFSKEEKEALEAEITELKAKIEELSKEEEVEEEVELAKAIVPNPENKTEVKLTKLAPNRKPGVSDRVLAYINKNK